MDKVIMKDIIKIKAIELFSEKGFYGTSIRDISKAAGCSIPMIYYYYNNKNELFEEVVYNEFVLLIDRLNSQIQRGLPIEEIYFLAIKQRKGLNDYDKAVYKLAMKVWLRFEGSTEIRDKFIIWREGRYERNKRILSKVCSDINKLEILTSVMIGIFENITERIILLDEDISNEKIIEEVKFIIDCVKKH
ncbi:TetR/AcrR family transcriptional regulator [Maledivibacter halophilus]|uniref:Transcriptional regulator, TetR family n=1 Tax=Maledivibacter halophilus TaxID=36842 RepID=A0A1T5LTM5_9FIRM|nr:TetR/AcrR family transcriptional regulator [Maledivibacter halophilus]SKC78949.1 transcriptional regulator, TetR family [Maledivibacter halophilus]